MRNRKVRMMLLAVVGSIFLLSFVMVLRYVVEMRAGEMQDEALTQMLVETVPQETEPQSEPTEETAQEETAPIETVPPIVAPIQVDFEALLAENPDVVGWLYCPDTKINYPVVQAEDNEYYLHRLLDGRGNSRGTLFMDYQNEADLSHWNSVIYGHNMKNKTMFGSLTGYKQQAYYDAHPEMYFLTPERDYLIKLVAGFVTRADADVFNIFDPDEEKREEMLNSWLEKSSFVSENEPDPDDRFITLSTCSYEFSNARYVVIGILE